MVGERRQEGVGQVAVGGMKFQHLEPGRVRISGGGGEGLLDRFDILQAHLMGHQRALVHGQGARRDNVPGGIATRPVAFVQRSVTLPGPLHAGFAAGMGDLHSRHGAVGAEKRGDGFQRRGMIGRPNAEIAVGDTPALFDRGGFAEHQPRPAQRELAEMDFVPIVGQAVIGGVLAHGRNDHPVFQCRAAHGHGRE